MATVTEIRRNCMGTISFSAKFQGMRKPQEFIVYPNPEKDAIRVQADSRCGVICGDKIKLAKCEYFAMINALPCKVDTIDNIEQLLEAIRGTASPHAGTNGIIYTDNSTAAAV